jgi:hypothetical protein
MALLTAARFGISVAGSTIYSTQMIWSLGDWGCPTATSRGRSGPATTPETIAAETAPPMPNRAAATRIGT